MTNLTKIPGIGKKMAEHLADIGYLDIESLKGQDPMPTTTAYYRPISKTGEIGRHRYEK